MVAPARYASDVGAKQVVRLRVIGGNVEIDDVVPATRADCPTERPCPHVKCRYHLWMIDGRDNRGRRVEGRMPRSTLREVWLEWPLPETCALDLVGRVEHVDDMADLMGMCRTQFRWTAARARHKLGVSDDALAEFVEGHAPANDSDRDDEE